MVSNSAVHVHFIELVKTTDTEHVENKILSDLYPFYPSYKDGEQVFLHIIDEDKIDGGLKLTPFRVVDVVHSVRQSQKKYPKSNLYVTYLTLDVYLRKLD
jgi:hypothetical protein